MPRLVAKQQGCNITTVYSLKLQTGATVSTPLIRKEVKLGLKPSGFTIHTVPGKVKKIKDIFSAVMKSN